MVAVADGGSTKIDWVLANAAGSRVVYTTPGTNPFLLGSDEITDVLADTFRDSAITGEVAQVYFYGAGCSDPKRCDIMQAGLQRLFPQAELWVAHDLLGAARALCGHQPGIACILGTGSNSCLFDGHHITDNVPSLGYVAGDEGSGFDIGKRLLQHYYYREMPPDLAEAFRSGYVGDKQTVWDQMYGRQANVFFASLSTFAAAHQDHPFMKALLVGCFGHYLERHVLKYAGAAELPVHFVGSVAWHYRSMVAEALASKGLKAGRFLQKPIEALVDFHLGQTTMR
jgi:glucosamine kinase